jgi:hypothetical protein
MMRIAKIGLLGLALAALLVFVVDQVVLQVRIHRGTGLGVVQVNQFLTTQLKGQKEEYDWMGTVPAPCAHSLFPQVSAQPMVPPCWWLERHKNQWD